MPDINPTPKSAEDFVSSFAYPISYIERLPKPSHNYVSDFFELTRLRTSEKNLSDLSASQLSDLLWYAAKVIDTHYQDNGYILSHRPSPSAGARHPIDLLIINPSENPVFQYYNPFEHSLNNLKLNEDLFTDFVTHINDNIPVGKGTVIWLIAHVNRTSAKYDNPASLVWRDAGALLQILQMTATAMNLGSCPFGTLADPFINKLFADAAIISCGGIIIGNNLQL
ncbi:nitroreductase family protein [Mucilaginibacter sp. AW1-7]|uniref:nitroreductase family protein n=1 Tax=Mucilaginibacter sp. AW1-7 TaxID=3349874 RepID=UPI003F737ABC